MPALIPPHVRLGRALARVQDKVLHNHIVRTQDIRPMDRNLLIARQWLSPIAQGYFFFAKPDAATDTTAFRTQMYWPFLSQYMEDLAGKNYCVNAQGSLDLLTGNEVAPDQIILLTKETSNHQVQLKDGQRVVWYKDPVGFPSRIEVAREVNVMPLEIALSRLVAQDFIHCRDSIVLALQKVPPERVLAALLEKPVLDKAGRLASAYRAIGWDDAAEGILKTFRNAGYDNIKEELIDLPKTRIPLTRIKSPHAERLRMMWERMRETVEEKLISAPRNPGITVEEYLRRTKAIYVADAYNSLSIEGYKVTPELIQKVTQGNWKPDIDAIDKQQVDAMAAKGYYLAFQEVQKSIAKIFAGEEADAVLKKDLSDWYQAMFSPSVQAGILTASNLAGYRNHAVTLRGSAHAPPPHEALMDCMEMYFDLVKQERVPEVRAVLGHFVFTYIHPFGDGNGRIGRFIMNTMLASTRIPWTIITLETRQQYLNVLEMASSGKDIAPFAQFVRDQIDVSFKVSQAEGKSQIRDFKNLPAVKSSGPIKQELPAT